MTAAEWIESETREVQVFATICGVPGSSNRCKWGAYYTMKKVEAIKRAPGHTTITGLPTLLQ